MEALAWIADLLAVPTDEELLKLNIKTDDPKALVERIVDFVVPGLMVGATGKG